MIFYEFNPLGIIYTVSAAVPIALLIAATIVFCARRAEKGKLTLAFRVLDIALLAVLLFAWIVYVLSRVSIAGLSIVADGNDAALVLGEKTILVAPGCASITDIAASLLGTVLLGAVTALAVASLVLSFTRRGAFDASAENAAAVEESAAAEPEEPAISEELAPEEPEQPAISEEPASSEPEEPVGAQESVASEPEESAAEEEPVSDESEIAKNETACAEEPAAEDRKAEDAATLTPAAESVEPEPVVSEIGGESEPLLREDMETITDYSDRARGTSDRKYSSALQMPGAGSRQSGQAQRRGTEPARIIRPADTSLSGGYVRQSRPLPITRKLVITNRMNVVNMYNEYLNEKREREKEKITDTAEPDGENKNN